MWMWGGKLKMLRLCRPTPNPVSCPRRTPKRMRPQPKSEKGLGGRSGAWAAVSGTQGNTHSIEQDVEQQGAMQAREGRGKGTGRE